MGLTEKKQPDCARYIPLIVQALRDMNGVAKAAAVKEWIAAELTDKHEPIPETMLTSGTQKFSNDIQWARMYLVNAGFLEPMQTAGYGNWKLTQIGWSETVSQALVKVILDATVQKGKIQTSDSQEAPQEDPYQGELAGLVTWEFALKKTLTTMPHKGFERFCTRLMIDNGLVQAKVTGQTGDGGVDGEGMLPIDNYSFIKTPIAWQCKRYKGKKNNVGSRVCSQLAVRSYAKRDSC